MSPAATDSSSTAPSSSSPPRGEYRSPDGRTFDQLSFPEQDLLVNGPRISAGVLALAVLFWAGFLTFLVVLAWPYIVR